MEGNKIKDGITAKQIPSEFKAKSVNIILKPKAVLPIHTTPVDVIFYVIKGKGALTIGNETKEFEEGSFVDSPKDIPHGWENTGTEELSVLVIKLFH